MDSSLSDCRVLVVEDDMMVLMIIEDMLANFGCTAVTTAATVAQGLAAVDARAFDVAMLDVNLNGEKSYPVADALAAHGVPFCFATGYSDHAATGRHRDRPVLNKPFRYEDLAKLLSRLAAR